MGNIAPLAASSTQFPKISVPPRVDLAVICQGQGLGISATTGHLNHVLVRQGFDL